MQISDLNTATLVRIIHDGANYVTMRQTNDPNLRMSDKVDMNTVIAVAEELKERGY